MIDEILFNDGIGDARAALLSGGVIQEIRIEREDRVSQIGDIVLGRVQKVVPSLAAAFVDLGQGRSGFLTVRDAAPLTRARSGEDGENLTIERLVHEGEAVVVQVTKDGYGDKGPRISADISLAGRTVALTPHDPGARVSRRIADEAERERLMRAAWKALGGYDHLGAIIRTAAEGLDEARIESELQSLAVAWAEIAAKAETATAPAVLHREADLLSRLVRDVLTDAVTRFEVDTSGALQRAKRLAKTLCPGLEDRIVLYTGGPALFEDLGVEAEIEAALEPHVSLSGGAWISIERTEGLTAIDVNAGKSADTGSGRSPAMGVNLSAAREIARQIRLRGLSGLMVVDFIHVTASEDAARITQALEAAFAGDPVHTRVSAMSEFGLVEITRRREHESLADMLEGSCPTCGGHGHVPRLEAEVQAALRRAERDAASYPGGEFVLDASDAVAERLTAATDGASLLSRLEQRIGRRVRLERA
jgi:ribonuclease G